VKITYFPIWKIEILELNWKFNRLLHPTGEVSSGSLSLEHMDVSITVVPKAPYLRKGALPYISLVFATAHELREDLARAIMCKVTVVYEQSAS